MLDYEELHMNAGNEMGDRLSKDAPKGYENLANFKILVHFFGTVRNGNNVIVNYISKYNTIPAEWLSLGAIQRIHQ